MQRLKHKKQLLGRKSTFRCIFRHLLRCWVQTSSSWFSSRQALTSQRRLSTFPRLTVTWVSHFLHNDNFASVAFYLFICLSSKSFCSQTPQVVENCNILEQKKGGKNALKNSYYAVLRKRKPALLLRSDLQMWHWKAFTVSFSRRARHGL